MATPDRLELGLAATAPARLAAVQHAHRMGLSCEECLLEVRAVLEALPAELAGPSRSQRLAEWELAVARVYGRRAYLEALAELAAGGPDA